MFSTAQSYDIRIADTITELQENFTQAISVKQSDIINGNLSSPQEFGNLETFIIRVPISQNQTTVSYAFAIQSLDDANRFSEVSNVVFAVFREYIPPTGAPPTEPATAPTSRTYAPRTTTESVTAPTNWTGAPRTTTEPVPSNQTGAPRTPTEPVPTTGFSLTPSKPATLPYDPTPALSIGVIIGIVFGVIIAIVIAIVLVILVIVLCTSFCKSKQRDSKAEDQAFDNVMLETHESKEPKV